MKQFKKTEVYGVQSAESANSDLFSEKEIEILQTLGIEQLGKQRNIKLEHAKK